MNIETVVETTNERQSTHNLKTLNLLERDLFWLLSTSSDLVVSKTERTFLNQKIHQLMDFKKDLKLDTINSNLSPLSSSRLNEIILKGLNSWSQIKNNPTQTLQENIKLNLFLLRQLQAELKQLYPVAINSTGQVYLLRHNWPEASPSYFGISATTQLFFFEISLEASKIYLRATGETVVDAEDQVWKQWNRILACLNHEFELGGFTNGAGVCRYCNLIRSEVFPPTPKCKICHTETYWKQDLLQDWYCKNHQNSLPSRPL